MGSWKTRMKNTYNSSNGIMHADGDRASGDD